MADQPRNQTPRHGSKRSSQEGRRRAPEGEQRRRPPETPQFMDVSIRLGIDSYLVRLPTAHYGVLVTWWMLGEETVVLRCAYQNIERNIVLRGTSSAHVSVKAADQDTKLPTYNVYRAADLRKEWLTETEQ